MFRVFCGTLIALVGLLAANATAAEPAKVSLNEGKIEMTAPAGWKTVAPRVRIIKKIQE